MGGAGPTAIAQGTETGIGTNLDGHADILLFAHEVAGFMAR